MALNIVIPVAGQGKRMKSYGPKALIPVQNGETILARSLRVLREGFPDAAFTVITGFESEKIVKEVPEWVTVVRNEDFETTNVAYSCYLGLLQQGGPSIIVYGDLVFNSSAIAPWTTPYNQNVSSVLFYEDVKRKDEVGLTVVNGQVTSFSFGLPQKWLHMVFLAEREKALFVNIMSNPRNHRCLTYEVLNRVMEDGGSFFGIEPRNLNFVEVDSSSDIAGAKKVS